jgi:ubiquinone/menaquinone biosynthesis C-methylase UbiE
MRWLLDVLVPQLARPHGRLGQLVASLLNRGNRTINLHVLGALDVRPGARVLELGFGGGVGLALLLAHEPAVKASGIDLSPDMVQRCQKRFGDRVSLVQGTVDALPFADAAFDQVFGVNVSYFWPDLPRALAEVRRVLAPGGTFALGIRPPETLRRFQFDVAGHRVWEPSQYVQALSDAGFLDAAARRMPDADGASVVLARRAS